MIKRITSSKLPGVVRNALGWYGVLAILLAYVLLSFKWVQASGLPYQLLNLTGSLGIVAVAAAKRDVQPLALNIIWSLVAVVAICRIIIS